MENNVTKLKSIFKDYILDIIKFNLLMDSQFKPKSEVFLELSKLPFKQAYSVLEDINQYLEDHKITEEINYFYNEDNSYYPMTNDIILTEFSKLLESVLIEYKTQNKDLKDFLDIYFKNFSNTIFKIGILLLLIASLICAKVLFIVYSSLSLS